ncbi:hypothetical protein ZIOFF_069080 [Zingiber officinale]|uniref:DeSI-like protein n=1 Tax=Zingiber officinale TaxID=94328 RepID=A0A8J5EUZ2_ZINOF|nr:hypothetical protein ZIOFF_069080 [Zingiber officinale]
MKLLLKKGKNPFLPFRINRASSGFSLFLKARSASKTSGNVPVYLNVYDLTSINGYMYWAGLGIFHTGVEGSVCNFLLPEPLKTTVVRHDPDSQIEDGERRKLTSPYSCPSSISTCQKQFRASSLFLPSPFKGSLSRWELRRSSSCSVNCN